MALIRWQPLREMEVLSRQLEQLFELTPSSLETSAIAQKAWLPAVEMTTNDTEVILRAQIPGVDAKDLDVQVTRDRVSIKGESRSTAKTEGAQFVRSEFCYGHFQRVVGLPVAIQNDQVKADLTDGILTLVLPRLQAERPKVVKLNLTGETALVPEVANGATGVEPEKTASEPVLTEAVPTSAETGDVWAEQN